MCYTQLVHHLLYEGSRRAGRATVDDGAVKNEPMTDYIYKDKYIQKKKCGYTSKIKCGQLTGKEEEGCVLRNRGDGRFTRDKIRLDR
jgi:hypothetical protein